ncbi:restriction endonuclease subunit S [Salmonella enterica subsp. enterica]
MSRGKLPEGWVDTQLGNIVDYGKATKRVLSDVNDDTWVLELEDIEKESSKLLSTIRAGERPFKSTKNSFKKGDVLYGKLRPYLNKIILAEEDGVCTTEIIPLSAEPSCCNKYIFYWLKSSTFLGYVNDVSYGVNMPRLGTTDGLKAPLRLAPLAEQKIIAEKLDTLLAQVDSTKARLEQIPQILKRFRQAILTMAIKGDLTKNWRVENNITNVWTNQKASDLCIKVQSGSTPTGNPFEQNGKIPFLKVYNIVNQKIDFDYKPQFITDEVHRSKSKRSIAFPDDILMNIVGPPLGKIAILTDQYPEWNLNQAITLFRVDKEKLLSKFLYYVLCEGKLVRDVMHDTKGIVGQINISLTQCREAIIPCPSLLEQLEIVRRVEQLFAWADTIEKQVNSALTRVNSLTQSILAKAFRGELTAQWRAENPSLISGENSAAALLEKIKAERAASGGKKTSRKKV